MHVPELSMDIPADGHGGIHLMDVALLQKDVPNPATQGLHLSLWEVLAFEQLWRSKSEGIGFSVGRAGEQRGEGEG